MAQMLGFNVPIQGNQGVLMKLPGSQAGGYNVTDVSGWWLAGVPIQGNAELLHDMT
jgi:hypothetical protein